MLHKEKNHKFGSFSHLFRAGMMLAVLMLLAVLLPAAAHAPSQVGLAYDSENQTLKVTVTHQVSNPSNHYIYKIAIQKNAEEALTKEYTSQPSSSPFSYYYPINASEGDSLRATAYCRIAGSRSAEITVGDKAWAMKQAGADSAIE